jgi:Antitoxin ParD
MKQQHHHKQQETVRLTIDFPADQHTYIKMLAAKEGVSLRQFVIEHLPSLERNKKRHKDIEKGEFDELLRELLLEKADVLKRLAKK